MTVEFAAELTGACLLVNQAVTSLPVGHVDRQEEYHRGD